MTTRTLPHTLAQGQFAVTVELNPPKGTDVSELLETAKSLSGYVHGINVPDNAAAVMRASPVAVARLLYEQGHDPVLQLTCRDRNRLGLQSDLLGAHVLGIRNVLCLTGDSPGAGDHKDAKPVFDLDTVQLMHAVQELNQGRDLAGNTLEGRTAFLSVEPWPPAPNRLNSCTRNLRPRSTPAHNSFRHNPFFRRRQSSFSRKRCVLIPATC